MAQELRDSNIKVNAVCPSWVSTEMGGNMALVTPEDAAKDIVHFAILGESGRLEAFSDIKNPFLGNRVALVTRIIMLIQQPRIELQLVRISS